MKLKDLLNEGIIYLRNSQYIDPLYESRFILSDLLDVDISYIYAHEDEEIPKNIIDKYLLILKRRKKGEPLQYIFNKTYFYGNKFIVDKDVLIPRKDTEISVDILKDIINKNEIENFLEIGSGTGIVPISLSLMFSNIKFLTVDISDKAIQNTLKNINLYNIKNVIVKKSNLFENVENKFDLIYSNPPYIKTSEISNLQKEVKNYEPITALDGGFDGLYYYKLIINELNKFLNYNGYIVFEIGYDQSESVGNILKEANFKIEIVKDLSNNNRVIIGRR